MSKKRMITTRTRYILQKLRSHEHGRWEDATVPLHTLKVCETYLQPHRGGSQRIICRTTVEIDCTDWAALSLPLGSWKRPKGDLVYCAYVLQRNRALGGWQDVGYHSFKLGAIRNRAKYLKNRLGSIDKVRTIRRLVYEYKPEREY